MAICNKNIDQFEPPCRIGYSNDHASQEEANQQAIQECGNDCQIVSEFLAV